jgi:hypothetical protein
MGGNPASKHGAADGGYIRSVADANRYSVGNLKAEMPAGPYLGKRVRLSGFVKTDGVENWSGLWLRADGPNGVWLARDAMEDRPIKGTTDWKKYDLVVDVPAAAVNIAVGLRLVGRGKAWVDGVTLDVAGPGVAVTDGRERWTAAPGCEAGGNPAVSHGAQGGGYISHAGASSPCDLGTWTVPIPYLGRRARLSAYVRTENVVKQAGLFLTAAAGGTTAALDNMWDRPITGTTGWKNYDLVIDVPSSATNVSFGIFMDGAGKAWIDGVTLEVVGPDVAVTGSMPWFPTGSNPEEYDMGGNPAKPHGASGAGYIRSKVEKPTSFGGWATVSPAAAFLGKRVRLSGQARTEGIEQWAGLWMRVDGPNNEVLAFDNMAASNRPIKGTTGWTPYAVVLDVPASAANIMYGIVVNGAGKAWIDDVKLEAVGADVAVTEVKNPYTVYYAGQYEEAAKLFPARIARTPANLSLRLFHYLALHRSGKPDEARTFLAGVAGGLADQKWAAPVVLFYSGRASEDEVLKAAASTDATIDRQQKCEAYYYLAMAYLLKLGNVQGDGAVGAAKAKEYLEKCVATGVTTFVEYRAAKAELGRLTM